MSNKATTKSNSGKIQIVINLVIFGLAGLVYFLEGKNTLGTIYLVIGFLNALFIALFPKKPLRFFTFLYLIDAFAALFISFDFLFFRDSKYIHIVWLVIAIAYFITALLLLWRSNKNKPASSETGK